MVNSRLDALLSWCWPGYCLLCRARTGWNASLCEGCRLNLPWLASACSRCAAPLPPDTAGLACGACQQKPPPYRRSFAALHYGAPIDRVVLDLKYHRRLHLAAVLGELLATRLQGIATLPDAIVPVPLHLSRLRERGYNQSLEIARAVAKRVGVPLATGAARRLRATAAQTSLPLDQRARNVRNAFAANEEDVRGRHLAIVDDVMTSGHTVGALAKALRRAGAKEVSVWVVARAGS